MTAYCVLPQPETDIRFCPLDNNFLPRRPGCCNHLRIAGYTWLHLYWHTITDTLLVSTVVVVVVVVAVVAVVVVLLLVCTYMDKAITLPQILFPPITQRIADESSYITGTVENSIVVTHKVSGAETECIQIGVVLLIAGVLSNSEAKWVFGISMSSRLLDYIKGIDCGGMGLTCIGRRR